MAHADQGRYRTATIRGGLWLPYMILIVLLIAFWCFMMNKQSGGERVQVRLASPRAKLAQDDKRKVTFNDVAGADRKRPGYRKLLSSSKSPEVRADQRAYSKGVLLVGPPDTSKDPDRACGCRRAGIAVPVYFGFG